MGSPARVLILNERDPRHPRAGGAEIHVASIFSRLAERGHDVSMWNTGFAGAPAQERVDGIEVRRLGALPRYYAQVGPAVARATRSGRYDVVVECLNKLPFFSPLYSAVPVVAICHHLFGEVAFQQVPWPIAAVVWSAEKLVPACYRGVPFVAISESSREDLVRRGVDRDAITVSHCGVDPPTRSVDPSKPRPPRIAYLGRLEPYKRVDVVLRAARQLAPRIPDLEVVAIGRGSARPELERLARELGIADRTRFVGFVDDAERDALLAESRVCVFPSPKEGWGLVVIEANALGTPVVASHAPGLRDSVCDGETGFLVPHGDVDRFADRIAALLEDDALATGMAAKALAWSRRFDWDRAADEMARVLEQAREARAT